MIKKYCQSFILLSGILLTVLLVSCDPAKKYEKAESESIQNYLINNPSDTFDLKPSGLYFHNVLTGTGRTPLLHDTAYVQYTGMFLNGTVFDTNVGLDDLIFPVDEGYLIAGFDEGITYMKEGGKASFLVPSKLGYGSQGYAAIGGYTPLLYDVYLVRVKPGPGK